MKKILIIISAIFLILIALLGYFTYSVFSNPGSSIPVVFGEKQKLDSTDGRTNILAIGVDTRDSKYLQTGTLTDTLMLISVDPQTKDVKFLSIPRDFWVVVDGTGMKINEVYTLKGLDALLTKIQEITGVTVHYYAYADFNAVVKTVDAVGGITVDNPVAFTDYRYPKFGWENETCGIDVDSLNKEREVQWEKENKDNADAIKPSTFVNDEDFLCRYETISFEKGQVNLTGEQALKYARSRHSIDNGQGSDFARAHRQQLVILATLDKLLNANTLTDINKLRQLYSNFAEFIKTDFTINDMLVAIPYIEQSSSYNIQSKVLSNSGIYEEGGVLIQGAYENYGGRYVLVPEDTTKVKTFVNEYLYGNLVPEVTPTLQP